MQSFNLFGDTEEIILNDKTTLQKQLDKLAKTKTQETDVTKVLKSVKVSLEDKLKIITENVLKVLGKQKQNVLVIRDNDTFSTYIDKAIKVGRIAIDTETDNSLDPITCKLMGLCLYTEGEKQAYIPINHINNETGELLPNQLTEQDCREQLQRIVDANVFKIMHNGKFDYKVLKCTCNIEVIPEWDTMIAAKVLDENEFSAGLKQQYISKIDPTQEKYSIDHLFNSVKYAQVDPEIFALYAATDSLMTDKLYLWQKPRMEAAEKESPNKNIYKLFKEIEMPCVQVVAEMELTGVKFDLEYADRLHVKYQAKLDKIDAEINKELAVITDQIEKWKTTSEAINPTKVFVSAATKMSTEKIEATYPLIDKETTKRYKIGKSKLEQLETPINLASPTQLAILFYDILKLKNKDPEDRSTGEEALKHLAKETPIAKLLLDRRGTVKLLDAFIDALPKKVNAKTGRIHCAFNQYGAATGRFSSSEPNLQQIPSHDKNIRMLFTADTTYQQVELNDNYYKVPFSDEVETTNGWKAVADLIVGDIIVGTETKDVIKEIKHIEDNYYLYVEESLNEN